jgi:hypothetical protein
MKLTLSLVVSCLTLLSSYAQDGPRRVYLGVSTGLDNITGIVGPTLEFQFVPNLSVYGAAGLGSWGGKTSIGLRYYMNYPDGFAFNLGLSHATGLSEVSFDLQEEFVSGQSGNQMTRFKLLSANTVNVSALKHWLIGSRKRNRFYIEFGWAFPTEYDRYKTDAALTVQGRQFMQILQPGGLILGVGFNFGL